jgi:nuclear transport factor 2 (NTF2) superfamily protein
MNDREQQDFIDVPLKEGYTRIYSDHTGRWFDDYSPEQMEFMRNDPLMKIIHEEITKEIDREIIRQMVKNIR